MDLRTQKGHSERHRARSSPRRTGHRAGLVPPGLKPYAGAVGISPDFGFFRLGTEQAGNLHTWRAGVVMQAERIRAAIAAGRDVGDHAREASLRLDADSHFLLVAVRSGMRLAKRVQKVMTDERLGEAMAAFAEEFPTTTDLRDVLTHIDEYVLNQGQLQPGGRSKGEVEDGSFSFRVYTNDGDAVVAFGPFAVKLLAVAAATERVLDLAAEVWQRGMQEGADGPGAVEGDGG